MQKTLLLSASLILFAGCQSVDKKADEPQLNHRKIPTQVQESMANEEEYDERKKEYWNYIHGNQENWEIIKRQNFIAKYQERAWKRSVRAVETFADGQFDAEWIERGSDNQAGNVRITDYDPDTDNIYAISDGGTLWKGNIYGLTWTPLNEDMVFSREVIKITHLADGSLRIIAGIGAGLWYSDDEGENWTESTGISPFPDGGRGIDLVELNDTDSTLVYLCLRQTGPSSWINSILYSTDHGETFTHVQDLSTTDDEMASMAMPYGSDHAYILDNDEDIYKFSGTSLSTVSSGLSIGGGSTMQLEVSANTTDTVLFALMDEIDLYKSTDKGLSFSYVSTLPTNTWNCGFGLSLEDPDKLYYGEMELYRSHDGGLSWTKVSEWWEYYDDVPNKIHADIMEIKPCKQSDGTEFTLIPNHGGISISYDHLLSTPNIGEADLNVGQFYDVLTSPINSSFVYGGTQDQGFLRTNDGESTNPSSFVQVISGDYGEMQLSNNGTSLWTQYPGGDFAFYENAMTDGGPTLWYDVNGTDMPNVNWIIPTGPPTFEDDTYIYVAGGNLSGGAGSHVIKLDYTGGSVDASQFDHDFKASSGGTIAAIETTPLHPDFIYVSTGNGKFYRSTNGGTDFTETSSFTGPGSSWIYSGDIFASKQTPGLIFVGGSAGGVSPVYMSLDSGSTFTPINTGLPNTMVHEMAMDPAEKFLFAATDAGPYVYSMETEQWYDILGLAAPVQEYISVEFVEAEHIVRFGTWGRGIWDLKMQYDVGIEEETSSGKEPLLLYPNPASAYVNLKVGTLSKIQIVNSGGKIVLESALKEGKNKVNISSLENGFYVARIGDIHGKVTTQTFIVRNQ